MPAVPASASPLPFRRQLLLLLAQHLLILLAALGIFLLDRYEQFSPGLITALLVLLALAKGGYFLLYNFRAITTAERVKHTFSRFLVLVSVNLVIIVISYALDYFCLYKIDEQAFQGWVPGPDWAVLGQFLYLSVTSLTSAVLGDIVPRTGVARLLLSAEVLTGFVTTIFIISNFSNHTAAK